MMLTGLTSGKIAVIGAALCGIGLMYMIKFIWFLELISYFVFINANFGENLSKQHEIIYDWVHFDIIEGINNYYLKTRKNEQGYFWAGKISMMEVSAFISANTNYEFFLVILFGILASVAWFQ